MYVLVHVCMCVHMYVLVFVRMYAVCLHVCMCVIVHARTHNVAGLQA